MLLREYLRKQANRIDDKDDAVASFTKYVFPLKETGRDITAPPATYTHAHIDGRTAEKAAPTQINTPKVPVVLQKGSVFDRISDSRPKVWAEQDLRRLIDSTIFGKTIAYTLKDLAKKSLGRHSYSSFTQWIVNTPPPRKFSQPTFKIFDGRSDLADHVGRF